MTSILHDHETFYAELIARNRGLIAPADQDRLRRARFVIAGCGSTGGACVVPLVRSGAEHFALLDPGTFELNNLNRQDATVIDLGQNKARVAAAHVWAVNPFADVDVHEDGVLPATVGCLLRPGDLVIDAIDVTSASGLEAKLALHRAGVERRVPAITAYDIAGTQVIELFDYRRLRRPFNGKAGSTTDPDRLLRSLISPFALPREIFTELRRRRADPTRGFPQLAMTSTLLGAIIVPYSLRVLSGGPVRQRLALDLNQLVRPVPVRFLERARRDLGLVRLWWEFRA